MCALGRDEQLQDGAASATADPHMQAPDAKPTFATILLVACVNLAPVMLFRRMGHDCVVIHHWDDRQSPVIHDFEIGTPLIEIG